MSTGRYISESAAPTPPCNHKGVKPPQPKGLPSSSPTNVRWACHCGQQFVTTWVAGPRTSREPDLRWKSVNTRHVLPSEAQ